MPAFVDFQASRNLGAGKHRDARMVSANLGSVKKFGDMRWLYSFAVKDANALIAQFAEDDVAAGVAGAIGNQQQRAAPVGGLSHLGVVGLPRSVAARGPSWRAVRARAGLLLAFEAR